MSVETQHPQYSNNINKNKLMRDVIAGDDAIKKNAKTYVPPLSGQDKDEYKAYIERPSFTNFTARTLDGLTGLVFSKPAIKDIPDSMIDIINNIGLDNKNIVDFSEEIMSEVLITGRTGILIDMPTVDTVGLTKAEAELLNIRPYARIYSTESIINWKYETINNKSILSMVVLEENSYNYKNDFEKEAQIVYRVLMLIENIYTIRIYEKIDKEYVITKEIIPKVNNNTLNYIPFVGITPSILSLNIAKSPLYDLAKINITHFKLSVDYYHGIHFTALPTPYGSGIQLNNDEKIKVGSTSFMMFPDPDARLSYLEFNGDGLGTIEREKNNLKNEMVVMGSNMLQGDKNVAEAEKTVAMRNAGQNATLISTSDTVSRGIQKVLEIMAEWMGISEKISYKLNSDYNLSQLDAQTITALTNSWISGAISKQDLFYNFKKGEVIEDVKTFEEQQTEINEEVPQIRINN